VTIQNRRRNLSREKEEYRPSKQKEGREEPTRMNKKTNLRSLHELRNGKARKREKCNQRRGRAKWKRPPMKKNCKVPDPTIKEEKQMEEENEGDQKEWTLVISHGAQKWNLCCLPNRKRREKRGVLKIPSFRTKP